MSLSVPRFNYLVLVFNIFFTIFYLKVCGDIHSNPGPIRYPCVVCYKPVAVNHRALLCDGCNCWVHCRCGGIHVSQSQYTVYQSLSAFSWLCPRCLVGECPFFNCSVLSSPGGTHTSQQFSDTSTSGEGGQFSLSSTVVRGSLQFVHINARSLLSIIDDIFDLLSRGNIDVLALSETWLDETVMDSEICPIGYTLIRRDRNRCGGGVAVYLSERVSYTIHTPVNSGSIDQSWIIAMWSMVQYQLSLVKLLIVFITR